MRHAILIRLAHASLIRFAPARAAGGAFAFYSKSFSNGLMAWLFWRIGKVTSPTFPATIFMFAMPSLSVVPTHQYGTNQASSGTWPLGFEVTLGGATTWTVCPPKLHRH